MGLFPCFVAVELMERAILNKVMGSNFFLLDLCPNVESTECVPLCSDLVLVLCSSVDQITMNDEMPDS